MKISSLILILITLSFSVAGQDLPTIKPMVYGANSYSKADQLLWEKTLQIYASVNSGELDYEKLSSKDRMMIDSLESGYGPLTEGVGCSWYCGGGPYKITASSYLIDQGNINYKPENIHDFDLFTAWVPDNSGQAIGKKINFHFKPFSPRLTEIIVWNGYLKNTDLWKANSRVAKFKLIIDGKPVAILDLQDSTSTQTFKIDPIQSTDSTKDLVLTLEILELYKGLRYEDVAISEINFDGLDVHCFGAGTLITMADKSTKKIEEIKTDDRVLTYDMETKSLISTQVSELVIARHPNLLTLKFADREIIAADDHPFWTESKNWASINPNKSNENYLQESEVMRLVVGDKVYMPVEDKFVELLEIQKINTEFLSFTINLKLGNNFIANGILVKTEELQVE